MYISKYYIKLFLKKTVAKNESPSVEHDFNVTKVKVES